MVGDVNATSFVVFCNVLRGMFKSTLGGDRFRSTCNLCSKFKSTLGGGRFRSTLVLGGRFKFTLQGGRFRSMLGDRRVLSAVRSSGPGRGCARCSCSAICSSALRTGSPACKLGTILDGGVVRR